MGRLERITNDAERMVACDYLEPSASSLRERIRYERDKVLGEDIFKQLKAKRRIHADAPVFARIKDDIKLAKISYKEAIDEFCEKVPSKYAAKLRDIVKKKKKKRVDALIYGLVEGKELPEEFYIGVLQDVLKVSQSEARKIYSALEIVSESLEEKSHEPSKLIIK